MNTLAGVKEGTFCVLVETNGKEQSYIVSFDRNVIQRENEYRDDVFNLHELTSCETGSQLIFDFSYIHAQEERKSYTGGTVTSITTW